MSGKNIFWHSTFGTSSVHTSSRLWEKFRLALYHYQLRALCVDQNAGFALRQIIDTFRGLDERRRCDTVFFLALLCFLFFCWDRCCARRPFQVNWIVFPSSSLSTLSTCRIARTNLSRISASRIICAAKYMHTKRFTSSLLEATAPQPWPVWKL